MSLYKGSVLVSKLCVGAQIVSAAYSNGVNILGGDVYRFAATRLRIPSVQATVNSANTYFIHEGSFASPDYTVTDPAFLLPAFYSTQNTPNDVVLSLPYVCHGLAIKVGSTWHRASIDSAVGVTITPSLITPGVWVTLTGVTIPANTVCRVQSVINGYNGGSNGSAPSQTTYTGDIRVAASALGTAGSGLLNMFADNGGTLTGSHSGFSGVFMPAMIVAKSPASAMVHLILGDSISEGKNDSADPTVRGEHGFLTIGLDDNSTSKRQAFGHIGLAGTNPAQQTTLANWLGRYNALLQAKALNAGGEWPFNSIISEHGTNSLSINLAGTTMPAYFGMLRSTFPGVRLTQTELISRPTSSTDGWQTVGNMTVTDASLNGYAGRSTANGGTNAAAGGRWDTNIAIGGANGLGAVVANSSYYQAGHIDDSFAPWRYGSYDTGSNRDKPKVRAFTSTVAATYSNTTTIQLAGQPPNVGDTLILYSDATFTTAEGDGTILNVTGSGPYTVTLAGGIGNAVVGDAVATALHDRTGLHPGTYGHRSVYHQSVIDWKIARGWV